MSTSLLNRILVFTDAEALSLHYNVSVSMIILFSLVFLLLHSAGSAPYGRHINNFSYIPLGPEINPTIAWILQEIPNLVWIFIPIIYPQSFLCRDSHSNIILLVLFAIHYINRTLIYPFRIKSKRGFPLLVMLFAFAFTSINGYIQVRSLASFSCHPSTHIRCATFLIGLSLFLSGMYINIRSDGMLQTLRKPGETSYKIPRGFVFEYVSCGNLFGEVLEWIGFGVASWSIAGLMFAVCTFCNLGPRAQDHHRWYQRKFQDYPLHRRAVIPFVY